MDSQKTTFKNRFYQCLAALILVIAVYFRLIHLGNIPGINGDEAWSGVQALLWKSGRPSATQTSSGNPLSPIYQIPLAWIHCWVPPSFIALRSIAVLSNFMALILMGIFTYYLFGRTLALIQLILMSILPTAIAHSRFGQEPTQSILASVLIVYLSLVSLHTKRFQFAILLAAMIALPPALLIHPTNLFCVPFIFYPLWHWGSKWIRRRGNQAHRVFYLVCIVATLLLLFSYKFIWPIIYKYADGHSFLNYSWTKVAFTHLLSPSAHWEFWKNYGRLFTGVTVYQYISGAMLHLWVYDLLAITMGLFLFWGLRLMVRRRMTSLDKGLVYGWLIMLLFYFLFAGPEAIRPHVERYGLCLLVPATLVFARVLVEVYRAYPKLQFVQLNLACLFAFGLLTSFYLNYFDEFKTTGGRSHPTFITGPTEPKAKALELILNLQNPSRDVGIIAQEWWNFWPIRYLAYYHPSLQIEPTLAAAEKAGFRRALEVGNLFFIEFNGSDGHRAALDWIAVRKLRAVSFPIFDSSGRVVTVVLQASNK